MNATDHPALGLIDLSDRTQIELTGNDRATFLHNFCTADINSLAPGHGCEAMILSVKGKVLALVHVFCCQDSLVIEADVNLAETVTQHLDRYIIREDVNLVDQSKPCSQWAVIGHRVEATLRDLWGTDPPLKLFDHVKISGDSHTVQIRCVDLYGQPTYLLAVEREHHSLVGQLLTSAGASSLSTEVAEQLRIEQGTPRAGRELEPASLPQELQRDDRAISFNKGCYLGQETVARIDALGHVNRLLVGLQFQSSHVPQAGTELMVEDKRVGHVTSATFSPKLNHPLALGYVKRGLHQQGTQLTSDHGAATVVVLPLTESSD